MEELIIKNERLYIYRSENETDYMKYYFNYYDLKEGVSYLMIIITSQYNLRYFSIGVGKNITDYNGFLKLNPLAYAFFALLLLIL